jgi:hypothetical protein
MGTFFLLNFDLNSAWLKLEFQSDIASFFGRC